MVQSSGILDVYWSSIPGTTEWFNVQYDGEQEVLSLNLYDTDTVLIMATLTSLDSYVNTWPFIVTAFSDLHYEPWIIGCVNYIMHECFLVLFDAIKWASKSHSYTGASFIFSSYQKWWENKIFMILYYLWCHAMYCNLLLKAKMHT